MFFTIDRQIKVSSSETRNPQDPNISGNPGPPVTPRYPRIHSGDSQGTPAPADIIPEP
jgi:hypothetical protein